MSDFLTSKHPIFSQVLDWKFYSYTAHFHNLIPWPNPKIVGLEKKNTWQVLIISMQKIFSLFFFVGNIGNCSIFGMSRRPTDLTNIYESAQHEYSFQLFKSRFHHERLLSCMHVWPAISCKAMGEDEHFTNIRPFRQICHSGIFPSHIVTKDIVMDNRLMVLRVYNQALAFFISPTSVSS